MNNPDPQFQSGKFEGQVLADLAYIKETLCKKVDRDEFIPVKSIAYGMVGLILTAVLGAMIATVVKAIG